MLSDYFIQRLSENLPYVPTEEQADLIARLSAFLWDDNVPSVFLLKGYAGTGKTSLIGALVKTLESFERTCVLLAPTGRAAKVFASQGQQRSAVLSLKLAQLELAGAESGEAPILMLDDVMSELDPSRRRQLIERIDRVQTFVTCTDLSDLAGAREGAGYRVENGVLTRE